MRRGAIKLFTIIGAFCSILLGVVTVSLASDTTPPVSAITAPANGAHIRATSSNPYPHYTITGTASDEEGGTGVQKVEVGITLQIGPTIWLDATGTTSWSVDWAIPTDGPCLITARATDNANNVEIQLTSISVQVDNTPPVVNIDPYYFTSKWAAAPFVQTASAYDTSSMTYSWEQLSGPGTVTFSSPHALSTTISADIYGDYLIRFTATDSTGNSAYSELTLTWTTVTSASPLWAQQLGFQAIMLFMVDLQQCHCLLYCCSLVG